MSQLDWSRAIVRASAAFTIDFNISAANGSIAMARPRRAGAQERQLTIDEVALLTAMKKPGLVPEALRRRIHDCEQVLARLVLDGVIEVREEGRFRSGAAVLEPGGRTATLDEAGPATRISELALEYAIAVRHIKPGELSQRLYAFNSLPRTGSGQTDFCVRTGIDPSSPIVRIGGRDWTAQPTPKWLYFRRKAGSGGRFKIYLSPAVDEISKVLDGFAGVLGRRDATFKIAFPADSLRRPDKIVAYVPTFAALQKALSDLASAGLDAKVQAVPFSAPVAASPLLSWGVDPPGISTRGGASWRSWVASQVAECAHAVPLSAGPGEALAHLKAALQVRDIDPVQWLPRQHLLSQKWSLEL